MSSASTRTRTGLTPLISVSACAAAFAILLVLVRTQWAPLESIDRGLATNLNNAISGHASIVGVVKKITWLGSGGVLWTVIAAGAVITLVRRRWRLTVYLLVAGAGALILDPVLKSLVGRVRPVVAHPVSHGTGNSFPSGHSLGSIVCYGAILLVFLPAAAPRWRPYAKAAVAVLVAAIGISRILLGVHYLSDVLGAWALGIAWLGLTAYAFELMRRENAQPVTDPLVEGLEPEAAEDLEPAQSEPKNQRHIGRTAAAVAVAWILALGIVVGFGELITKYGGGNVAGDETIPHWFAAHSTPTLNRWSQVFSTLGATQAILIIALTTCVVALAVTRRWRPVVFVAALMLGELSVFLTAAAIVQRPRPDVRHLDPPLPTSAYPSGHVAASLCMYIGLAVLVIGHARGWWRWLFLVPAIAMPIMVACARMYRGEHHPTDVLGSVIFAALWIPAMYVLIRPNRATAPAGLVSRDVTEHPAPVHAG